MTVIDSRRLLERGICSPGRLRIIGALANPESTLLSKYQLERRTGIRSSSLNSDIKVLMELGWVLQTGESERRRLYTLNRRNELLEKVINFLSSAGYLQRI
jgi:hypothetical protein